MELFKNIRNWIVINYYAFLKWYKETKNKIVNKLITKHFTNKGKRIAKTYQVGETYYNVMKKCYGIYRGNNTFYESKVLNTNGITFYDSRNVTYTDLQIGLFQLWEKKYAKVETNCGPELYNNPYHPDKLSKG